MFRFKEWYGWRGQPNEGSRMLVADIAKGIIEREIKWGLRAEDGSWSLDLAGLERAFAGGANGNGGAIVDLGQLLDFENGGWLALELGQLSGAHCVAKMRHHSSKRFHDGAR